MNFRLVQPWIEIPVLLFGMWSFATDLFLVSDFLSVGMMFKIINNWHGPGADLIITLIKMDSFEKLVQLYQYQLVKNNTAHL